MPKYYISTEQDWIDTNLFHEVVIADMKQSDYGETRHSNLSTDEIKLYYVAVNASRWLGIIGYTMTI